MHADTSFKHNTVRLYIAQISYFCVMQTTYKGQQSHFIANQNKDACTHNTKSDG